MITLDIGGFAVDIAPNTPLNLEIDNPHLRYESLVGRKVSFPALPITPVNRRIFNYADQVQTGNLFPRSTIAQYYNGQLIQEGLFLLTEVGQTGYTGALVDLLDEFFGDAQNKPLNELNLGQLVLPTPMSPLVMDGTRQALAFPVVINPTFYGDNATVANYNGRVNDYAGEAYTAAPPKVPFVFLTYVLHQFGVLTNTPIGGSFLTHPQYSNLLLYNTRALDGLTTVMTAQHLPTLTFGQLLVEMRKLFNLKYTFNVVDKKLTIDFWDPCFGLPTGIDWSAKAVGRAIKTPEVNARLQLGYELDGNDGLTKNNPADLADYLTPGTATGIAKISSRISTPVLDAASGTIGASQVGITAQFGQLTSTFSPRLTFWLGMINGTPKAGPQLGGYSLFWNGDFGLRTNHWRNTENARKQWFYAKQEVLLNEADLATLDWGKKIHLNGMDYLVASVNVSFPIVKPALCLLIGGV